MKTPSMKTRALGLMAGLVGTLGLALSAQAGDVQQMTALVSDSTVVRYDDLSLESGAGVHALYARLSNAADRVCGGRPNKVELRQLANYRSCYKDALNRAVDEIGNDHLQAVHQADSRPHTVS